MTETEALVSQLREQADRVSGLFTVCDLLCRAADALEARSLDSEDLDWLEANGKDICIYGPDDRWGWEMSWALRSGGHAGGTLREAIRAAREASKGKRNV